MKKTHLVSAAMLAFAGVCVAGAASVRLDRLELSSPLKITAPLLNDTLNPQGKKYDTRSLVKTRVNDKGIRFTNVTAKDSAGFALTLPSAGYELSLGRTRIRAQRFFKGKISVESAAPVQVLIDGKEIIDKSAAGRAEASSPVTLNPEQTYDVAIRVLTAATDSVAPRLKVTISPDKKYEDVALSIAPDLKDRFGVTDLSLGSRVNTVTVSPDGRYYTTLFNNKFSKDKSYNYTTVCESRTGRTVARYQGLKLHWLPKGARLYYTVPGADGKDVRAIDPATGADELLAAGIPDDADIAAWSPDMSYFLYYTQDKGVKEEGPLRRYSEPDDRIPGSRERSFLSIYDMATGMASPLTGGTSSTVLADISADGKQILFMKPVTRPEKFPFYASSLYLLRPATMQCDTIIADDPYVKTAAFSPDAKRLVLTGGPLAFGGIGNNSGDHPIPNDFDTQAFIMDLATKDVKALTRDFNPAIVSDPVWNRADGRIYFIGEDGFYRRVYVCNPSDGTIRVLPQQCDVVRQFSLGDDESTWLAYTGQGLEQNGAAYMLNLKNNKSTLIANPYDATLSRMELGHSEPWTFTAKDGTQIDGVMCLPPNFDPSKKYPLIVYYYGGTNPTNNSLSSPYNAQLLASRDYVVYILNPSGATGYGQEFSARHVNAWGKRTVDEIVQGTKEFVKAHPFVDGKKIGCMGASYGGFMTEYLQTVTDIFAAAVSHAGISNVTSYWGEGFWGYSYNSVAAAQSYPWTNPELFTKQGALFNADKIHTPLLLLHGTADTNVPIGESIQLFNALKILGRDVEFISVDGENHFVLDYEKRILWQNTIMAWFAKWLQDDPRWWDSMYPEVHLK